MSTMKADGTYGEFLCDNVRVCEEDNTAPPTPTYPPIGMLLSCILMLHRNKDYLALHHRLCCTAQYFPRSMLQWLQCGMICCSVTLAKVLSPCKNHANYHIPYLA